MKNNVCALTLCMGLVFSLLLQPSFALSQTHPGFSSQKLNTEIKQRITGLSYPKTGAQIRYTSLRYLQVKYYDFNGQVQTGELIVNKKIAKKILHIFYKLYEKKYPIQKMKLVDDYGANDTKSMANNNTSAFNYRTVEGTTRLSKHAMGLAIDINPKINPYLTYNTAGNLIRYSPKNGKAYLNRNKKTCTGKYAAYMIKENNYIVKLFKKNGFRWGGDWIYTKDYQHFDYIG